MEGESFDALTLSTVWVQECREKGCNEGICAPLCKALQVLNIAGV